jgi:NADPH:quinone reductase-like Zn-dependent oxidoreductase
MKAIVYEEYGPPDVLVLREIDEPVVKDNEVFLQVHATSVNPADWHDMRWAPGCSDRADAS